MANLQYLPPDFEQRCAAYRVALEDAYASGSLDDAGRWRLKEERERIKLRAEDAKELEQAYLQQNTLLLLERRIGAQIEVAVERAVKAHFIKLEYRLFDAIEAQMTTLQQQLEPLRGLPKILQTIESNQAALLEEITKSQTLSTNQAESLATLQQRLQAVETKTRVIYDAVVSERSPKDGMEQVYVPAGEFLMGSRDDDPDAHSDEKPQHTVYLDGYWIDKTPVTNAMFAKFVAETDYATEAEKKGNAYAYTGSTWEWVKGAQWRHPRGPSSDISGKDNHPVVCVSWNDANAYAKWAGRRLPTEAEWEKAAGGVLTPSGEGTRKWPWGNEPPTDKLCNFGWNVGDTTPVGNYPAGASPYGALDMAGNVWEWCCNTFDANICTSPPPANPQGPSSRRTKVLRGGSWYYLAPSSRVRDRIRSVVNNRIVIVGMGFRCARSPVGT